MSAISKIENMLRAALTLLTIGVMAACTTGEGIDDAMPQPSAGKLRLSTGSSVTRGDDHYDDDPYGEQNETRQEEKIDRVDLFFFSDAESDEASFFTYEVKNVGEITTADLSVRIPIEMTQRFTDGTAYVYALVNLPSDIRVSESSNSIGGRAATLETLTSVWVHASGFVSKDIPSSFVMRGGSEVTITGDGKNAEVYGVIRLERLASKIRLWAEIPEELYFDADGKTVYRFDGESDSDWEARKARETVETWESVPVQSDGESNVMLYIYNIATNGRIDGYLGSEGSRPDLGYDNVDRRDEVESAVRRLSKDVQLAEPVEEKYKKYNYTHAAPYYSYPNEWDSTTPVEEHQTYVIISMPWRRRASDGTGELYQTCYYQVPVNALKSEGADGDRLDPNRYYRIKIHIGMLGSKDLGSPTEVEASWEVVDWVTADVDVTIKDRRYLVVNQKEWTMNNVSTVEIPFYSSHEVEIEYCYVNYFRYCDAWGTDANSRVPVESNFDGTTSRWGDLSHSKEEFENWLKAADKLQNGRTDEGLITANFDGKIGDELYYKQKYFYDDIYKDYRYYVGHEQPKTFKRSARYYNDGVGMTSEEKDAWKLYNLKYDNLNAIYEYTIDTEKGVINFSHPLIQWKEVRTNNDRTGEIKYYVPQLNQRTNNLWDEYSRCEIILKIKHKDWNHDDDLYSETIYITQYPAMYVEVSHDYGSPATFERDANGTAHGNEYVSVNGNKIEDIPIILNVYPDGSYTQSNDASYSTEWFETGRWVEYFGSINNNPNMYVIHTSQLSEDNEMLYDLGDPRLLYYNNLLTDDSFKGNVAEPSRWGNNDDFRPSNNNGSQIYGKALEADDRKNQGPAWWTTRDYRYNEPLFGSTSEYQYSNYKYIESVYSETKANNIGTPDRTYRERYGILWGNWIWDYVNNKNNICYYYPTDESTGAGSKENFIAPSFRIASSFGKVTLDKNNKAQARWRCAAYQESGRPAGRWRLPTKAEVEYLVQLSNDEKIPILFGYPVATDEYGNTACYWTANGSIGVRVQTLSDGKYEGVIETGNAEATNSVRCVYDEWYWTKVDAEIGFTPNPLDTEFKWGDRPKDNTQVQTIMQTSINPQAIVAND